MTPHSMMFPGLHPNAMMSTVGIPSHPVNNSYSRQLQGAGGSAGGSSSSGGFMSQPGGPPSRGPMSSNQVRQETTYLYIPYSAVGAIIGE